MVSYTIHNQIKAKIIHLDPFNRAKYTCKTHKNGNKKNKVHLYSAIHYSFYTQLLHVFTDSYKQLAATQQQWRSWSHLSYMEVAWWDSASPIATSCIIWFHQ